MSLYVIHMDHPTGFCGLILADHSLFSPRCVPSQLSSLISVEIPCVTICHTYSLFSHGVSLPTWIILLDSVA